MIEPEGALVRAFDEAPARERFEKGALGRRGEGQAGAGLTRRPTATFDDLDEGQVDASVRVDPGDHRPTAGEGVSKLRVGGRDTPDRQIADEVDGSDVWPRLGH